MAAGNKIPKITDFDTLEAYVNATLAADGPPKSMGKAVPDKKSMGKIGPGKAGPGNIVPDKKSMGKAGPGNIVSQKMRKPPQKGQNNG